MLALASVLKRLLNVAKLWMNVCFCVFRYRGLLKQYRTLLCAIRLLEYISIESI